MASTGSRKASQLQASTFQQLHGDVVLPSTLNYRERTHLKQQNAFQYGRIYSHTTLSGMTVYDRLTADAAVRHTLKAVTAKDACSAEDSPASSAHAAAVAIATGLDRHAAKTQQPRPISGYVSNNNPSLSCKQQESEAACAEPPLSALHPITLRSYYKKFPLEFLAASRPNTRTTNETLRMLGTYSSDAALAQRLGVHMPPGSCSSNLTGQ